jgi:hypothetical protein
MIGVYFKRYPDISGDHFSNPGVPELFVFFSSNFALISI